MKWIVRNVQPDDAVALTNILNPIIAAGQFTVLDTLFTPAEEHQFILDFPQRGIFHVAVQPETNQVVGFQTIEPFASYTKVFDHVGIIGTYVAASVRKQGVAAALFAATFAAMPAKGYQKAFAYVRADNPAALATYQKQGFQTIGVAQKQAYINGQYIDEVLIEKLL